MKLPSEYLASGWCQRESARSKNGTSVIPTGRAAVSWCLTGAMEASFGSDSDLYHTYMGEVKRRIIGIPDRIGVTDWNDHPRRTQAQVVRLARSVSKKLGLRKG